MFKGKPDMLNSKQPKIMPVNALFAAAQPSSVICMSESALVCYEDDGLPEMV